MSLELLTKAVTDHGAAVAAIGGKIDDTQAEIKQLSTRMFDLESKAAGGSEHLDTKAFGKGAGAVADFMKSDQLANVRNGANTTGRVELKGAGIKVLRKAALTTGSISIPAQRDPGLYNNPQPTLTLLDLLPSIPVTSGSFEYMQLKYVNSAAVQEKEGDLKAEAAPEFVLKKANISTVAHWLRASNQVLADAPALENQLGNLLTYGVSAKVEKEALNGSGAAGHMEGILPQATVFVPSATTGNTAVDRIGEAVTSLGAAGWVASAIVLNHTDWFSMTSIKDVDGNYVIGSPRDPGPLNLWSTPVVLSAGMPQGTALVLDTAQVAMLDREQATVQVSQHDRDNFVTNMLTILGEARAGVAVLAAGAVLKLALKAAA
ncbi:HK97 family phage major capsid protein [Pseudomonas amygdali pv. aesculi str. 0893_23]|uniref:phage major capsid protein n=1 Tax=Pseudomonas syringae group genomosp. 2 TaxID=251698 RepID=UPI0001CC4110|nr:MULTISPECIES: phage major capsid protein [Pseudomonas syringae group genomosp. 2]EGH00963.1 HK97 family phage major capsid protein [Pseudomonas amygdali pv. aesculi str. 0893_23]KPW08172.1 HK97 family phage major capsid protein [Pseudomonas amygdali pv. aesculi]MCQ3009870.1 phage major capsid protein [Pseudomonas savastanoi]